MQNTEVDWLAFTISFEEHDDDKRYFDERLEVLRFDKERTLGDSRALFLQSWATYNLSGTTHNAEIHRNSSRTMSVQSTGQDVPNWLSSLTTIEVLRRFANITTN